MNELKSCIIAIVSVIIALTGNILVMQYGWGLQVQSWGWVIWGTLGFSLLVGIFTQIAKN